MTSSYPDEILKKFEISDDDLRDLLHKFEAELEAGLDPETRENSDLKTLPTFITSTPDGSENGNFIALDLGGTNFRIMLVKISSGCRPSLVMDSQVYFISEQIMKGSGTQLFDYIVNDLYNFLDQRNLVENLPNLPIGFTFSFPTKNIGFKQTILVYWSKGFTCDGVVGQDIGQLLNEAIVRKFGQKFSNRDLPVVVNDTVGTMISSGYNYHDISMGLIVGTGTNMCYMEKRDKIKIISPQSEPPSDEMCMNCEWGTFGDVTGALRHIETEFDRQLDGGSVNAGVHRYEKMIGGMYLGELARKVIMKLHDDDVMFTDISSDSKLHEQGLSTAFISQLTEPNMSLHDVKKYLASLGLTASQHECGYIVQLCEALSLRAAKLCAVGVVGVGNRVLAHRSTNQLTIGVDGSVYKKHPTFSKMLKNYVKKLSGGDASYEFRISNDGSGKGAALVAAIDHRLQQSQISPTCRTEN